MLSLKNRNDRIRWTYYSIRCLNCFFIVIVIMFRVPKRLSVLNLHFFTVITLVSSFNYFVEKYTHLFTLTTIKLYLTIIIIYFYSKIDDNVHYEILIRNIIIV